MKAVFISYDQAHQDSIIESLNDSNARGYTLFEQTGGRGTKTGEPHLGSHAWPSENSAIITIVEDERAANIMSRLKALDDESPKLGLRAFQWPITATV